MAQATTGTAVTTAKDAKSTVTTAKDAKSTVTTAKDAKSAESRDFKETLQFASQVRTDGIASFTMDVSLPRNALVRVYDVKVHAERASAITVDRVAQVRTIPESASEPAAIILDFGTLRTVSGVEVQPGLSIVRITPWLGSAFAPSPVFPTTPGASDTNIVVLRKEIRTERLLVEVTGSASPELWSDMRVMLPEAPTDLEIRIDGGASVASFPGPAQPGPDAALTDQGWNNQGERIVHLGEALAKLTGDPTRNEQVTFKVVLSSRVPGELSMNALTVRVPSNPSQPAQGLPRQMSLIRRVRFDDDTAKELAFTEEGQQQIPVTMLPADAVIEEIRFMVAGVLPPERIIPPIGPGRGDLADLLISADHAACVRLRPNTGLSELTGIRVPLVVGGGGAEARLVLWRPDETTGEPFEAIPEGVSEPVALEGTDPNVEIWTTFPFKHAVPINDDAPPWAALLVSRGQLIWRLGTVTGEHDPIAAHEIRRGAPAGPWKFLPGPFQDPTSALGSVRGRLRVIGHAPKDAAVAALIIGIDAQTVEVTPTAKGVVASRSFSPGVRLGNLRVVSRVAGNVTLRDLDVVTIA